jgi:DNA-binding NarL/FixJ family response regulator
MDSYRIILADDHPLIRQGLRRLIGGVGDLEVIGEAGDGFELLSLLTLLTPQLVILDLSMPNLRGIEAVRAIKMKYPEVKILVLTMHKEYLHQARSAGADGYLLKEDADRELFSAIEKIRQGEFYLSPRMTDDPAGDRVALFDSLSNREREVLRLIAQGKSNRQIAESLFVSVRTVESHRAALLKKLHQRNTASLVKFAIEKGYA